MGISPEAKNPKSAPPKSKEDAAKTMATTENKLTKQKRVADKVRNEKRKIADEERAFKLLMKQAGKRTDAGKAELAKGGMIGRKKKTGDARKAPKPQPYHQDTSTHKRFVHKSTLKKYANSVRGVRWPEDWEQQ